MDGLFIFTVAAIAATAGILTIAVYRTLTANDDEAKFDSALAIIQASELDELDTGVKEKITEIEGGKVGFSWNKYWLKMALESGRIIDDAGTPGRFAAGAVIIGSLFGILVFPGGAKGIILGFLPIMFGQAWLSFEANKRKMAIDRQMPLMLSSLRSQMHAGVTVQAALMNIADDLPSPLGDEVRMVRNEVNVSIPLEQALDRLADRVASRQMQFLVSSIGIAVRSGADLVPQLVTIEEIVQQRARIEGKIKAAIALAKPTTYLAQGAPALMFLWFFFTDPDYSAYFFGEGILMLLVAAGLYGGGSFIVKVMIKGVDKI